MIYVHACTYVHMYVLCTMMHTDYRQLKSKSQGARVVAFVM